jgi:hypothetical protein
MNNKIKVSILLVVALLGTWLFFTPHLTVNSMKSAADAGDANKLASYVDFPSVKESLKTSIGAKISEATKDQQDNPFAFLGAAMAVAIINPLIDTFVTPSSLSMMMKGEKPSLEGKQARNSKSQSDTDVSMSYDGMNRFIVTVKKKNEDGKPLQLIYNRDGFFSWRLTAIDIPF